MKYLLIGLAALFVAGWLPQLISSWILNIRFWWKRKHDKSEDSWIYKI